MPFLDWLRIEIVWRSPSILFYWRPSNTRSDYRISTLPYLSTVFQRRLSIHVWAGLQSSARLSSPCRWTGFPFDGYRIPQGSVINATQSLIDLLFRSPSGWIDSSAIRIRSLNSFWRKDLSDLWPTVILPYSVKLMKCTIGRHRLAPSGMWCSANRTWIW